MLYEYECPVCGWQGAKFAKISNRDRQKCTQLVSASGYEGDENTLHECGADLMRVEIPSSTQVDPKGGFQMGAVSRSGKIIPGNFGKMPRKGKYYKP